MFHRSDNHRGSAAGTAWSGLVLISVACFVLPGCKSPLDLTASKSNSNEKLKELTSTKDIQGPLGRMVQAVLRRKKKDDDGTFKPAAGLAEYEAAEKLFEAGKHKQAEKAFKKVAKTYKNSPVREDALFMQAEAQFEQQRYSWAQDSYDQLLKDFPATRYMDRVTRRLFTIARIWLQFPEVATSDDIQPVNFDDPKSRRLTNDSKQKKGSSDPTRRIPILPNFFDRSRPVFDTQGRALQALRSIWMNDPTGSLADDALMLTASHHLRKGNYMEADRVFKIIREEYPKSPHLESAFVLGSHVSLMSYQGPQYDGTKLEESRRLKESTLRLFPNVADRERLRGELKEIDEARARRDWEQARFYLKKKNTRGAAIYCRLIIESFPHTSYAERARDLLAELKPGSSRVGNGGDSPPFEPEPLQPYDDNVRPGRVEL